MYKENIKVIDCTVRDGGLMNNWQFTDEFVRAVYDACAEAGVDYMEIGYISSEKAFSRLQFSLPAVLQFFGKNGYRFERLEFF